LVTAINEYREKYGYPPLRYSEQLSEIARAHVVDLAARNEVSSMNRQGAGIGNRLLDAGYKPYVAGSLVSGGYASIEDAMASWQADKVQRSRLLLQRANEVGFAVIEDRASTYGTYIEAIVAARQ
jgi:uncharacterized protein YkwD